jgi:hypothetical protein
MTPSVQALIRSLEERDIHLEVIKDRLRVDAPKGALTPELRRTLEENKPLLVSALKVDWAADARKVIDALPDEAVRPVLMDYFELTAAFVEYEQGRSPDETEQQAFGLLLFQILRRGIDVAVPS